MSLNSSDLDRQAADIYLDRRIKGSIYCGNCGYNLHTLPYAYRCPECGKDYNARPTKMEGIFYPHNASIPYGDMLTVVLWGTLTWLFARQGFNPPDPVYLVPSALTAGAAIAYVVSSYRRTCRFIHVRGIATRIAAEEDT